MLLKIPSYTENNYRSERVMQKLGMVRDVDSDFHHPKLGHDHPIMVGIAKTIILSKRKTLFFTSNYNLQNIHNGLCL